MIIQQHAVRIFRAECFHARFQAAALHEDVAMRWIHAEVPTPGLPILGGVVQNQDLAFGHAHGGGDISGG